MCTDIMSTIGSAANAWICLTDVAKIASDTSALALIGLSFGAKMIEKAPGRMQGPSAEDVKRVYELRPSGATRMRWPTLPSCLRMGRS